MIRLDTFEDNGYVYRQFWQNFLVDIYKRHLLELFEVRSRKEYLEKLGAFTQVRLSEYRAHQDSCGHLVFDNDEDAAWFLLRWS